VKGPLKRGRKKYISVWRERNKEKERKRERQMRKRIKRTFLGSEREKE
jgi:hypothetical protein